MAFSVNIFLSGHQPTPHKTLSHICSVIVILLTCVLGVLAIGTPAMIIQRTTPVTFQVVGHAKTVLVVLSDYIVFLKPLVLKVFLVQPPTSPSPFTGGRHLGP